MPAIMPMGVPISVPIAAMIKLPAIALERPPLAPGGGVIVRKSAGPRALKPASNKVNRIQPNQNSPINIVRSDTARLKRLIHNRREERPIDPPEALIAAGR